LEQSKILRALLAVLPNKYYLVDKSEEGEISRTSGTHGEFLQIFVTSILEKLKEKNSLAVLVVNGWWRRT
jgi:hypothetical protein